MTFFREPRKDQDHQQMMDDGATATDQSLKGKRQIDHDVTSPSAENENEMGVSAGTNLRTIEPNSTQLPILERTADQKQQVATELEVR